MAMEATMNKDWFDDEELNQAPLNEIDEEALAEAEAQAEAEEDALIEGLIEDIEELDSLVDEEAADLIEELRPYIVSEDVYEDFEETDSFLDKAADKIAEIVGSWGFIGSFLFLMVCWMGLNLYLGERALDPFPFILLNLALSTLAGLQAPVILMSQNRQAEVDRAISHNDYQVNLKSELEIADLHRKVDEMMEIIETQSKMMNALINARRDELRVTVKEIERRRHVDLLMHNETGMN
jgi:uncharacterized membrane protein